MSSDLFQKYGDSRQDLLEIAKLAEEAERFDDMVEAMRRIASFRKEMTIEERSLFAVAHKNMRTRHPLRVIMSMEERERLNRGAVDDRKLRIVGRYRQKIEAESTELSLTVLQILDEDLIPFAESAENRIFFLKMKGDYLRELAESRREMREDYKRLSREAYLRAKELSTQEFLPTNPTRLGMDLSLAVFSYEMLNRKEEAIRIASEAFENALDVIDKIPEDDYKEATLVMQLLRDNLTMWRADEIGLDADTLHNRRKGM